MMYRLMRLFAITISEGLHACALCGRSLDSFTWSRLVHETIELVEGGMLSSDGIALLAHLRKLPCRPCLARILGESLSTSCELSTASEKTSGGTSFTPSNFEWRAAEAGWKRFNGSSLYLHLEERDRMFTVTGQPDISAGRFSHRYYDRERYHSSAPATLGGCSEEKGPPFEFDCFCNQAKLVDSDGGGPYRYWPRWRVKR